MKPAEFIKKVWSFQKPKDGHYFSLSTKSLQGKWKDHFFKWPFEEDAIDNFFEKHPTDQFHLYFCPTGLSEPRRRKEFVVGSAMLWADLDEVDPRNVNPLPQIAWKSSPNRYAALWRLMDFQEPEIAEETNKLLSYSCGADRSGWDLTQVLRIPGTKNLKYKNAPTGQLLWFKDSRYSLGDFPDQVDEGPQEVLGRVRKKIKPTTYKLLTAARAEQGKRSEILWRLENELSSQGLSESEIFSLLKASVWNKFRGRRDEDSQLRNEIKKASSNSPTTLAPERPRQSGPVIVRLSDVTPEAVTWLWYPYIPKAKLTLIEGDPGLGKSWLTMALASHMSQRLKLPGQEKARGGRVLIMSAEDGLADTIRPRLDHLRADPRRVFAYNHPVSFDEVGALEVEEQIEELRPCLVIIDPLVAYLGSGVDLHKANETREVMARLSRIAEKYQVAIVAVRHLTKGNRDKSIYRGIGSIDLTAAARSVLMIAQDNEEPETRVICHIKSNLAPRGKSVQYLLRPSATRPFEWDGFTDKSAEELLSSDKLPGKGDIETAKDFLRQALEAGPVKVADLRRNAEAKGIAKKTINRAKKDLGVKTNRRDNDLYWSLH